MNLNQKHKIEKGFRVNIEESLYFNLFNKQIKKLTPQYKKYLYPELNLENKYKEKDKISRPCLVYERIGDFLILIPFTTSEKFTEANKTIKNNKKDSLLKVPFFLLNLDTDFIDRNKISKNNIYNWASDKEVKDNYELIKQYNSYLKTEHKDLYENLIDLTKNKVILNNSHSLNHLLYEVIVDPCRKEKNE